MGRKIKVRPCDMNQTPEALRDMLEKEIGKFGVFYTKGYSDSHKPISGYIFEVRKDDLVIGEHDLTRDIKNLEYIAIFDEE